MRPGCLGIAGANTETQWQRFEYSLAPGLQVVLAHYAQRFSLSESVGLPGV